MFRFFSVVHLIAVFTLGFAASPVHAQGSKTPKTVEISVKNHLGIATKDVVELKQNNIYINHFEVRPTSQKKALGYYKKLHVLETQPFNCIQGQYRITFDYGDSKQSIQSCIQSKEFLQIQKALTQIKYLPTQIPKKDKK